MNSPIVAKFISISDRTQESTSVAGFSHLWAMYVRGFDPRFHCKRCLRGHTSVHVKPRSTSVGKELIFSEVSGFDSIYICGVAQGEVRERYKNNLHLALALDSNAHFEHETYNGYVIRISNARRLAIPELPQDWKGLPSSSTRCCNFRFGVSRFGYEEN